jgi:glycosyltransferase involved in cell wall biosynthesis
MRSFSLFALSSIAEGTPVTMLEAMASGLPVVATARRRHPEVVQDGVTGSWCRRRPAALAEALAAYVRDPSWRAARRGRPRAHRTAATACRHAGRHYLACTTACANQNNPSRSNHTMCGIVGIFDARRPRDRPQLLSG